MPTPADRKQFKYYDIIMAFFVADLLCANLIAASKVTTIGGMTVTAGIVFFPISYFFGDVLTEVYGYARARRVTWVGFAALTFASLIAWWVVKAPPAPGWPNQQAVETIFGAAPRIVFASFTAFLVGEFVNSFVLAKMKVATGGKHFWARAIGSTVVGEAADSVIFYPLAFLGSWETSLVLKVMFGNYVMKVLWEVVAMPLTYSVVGYLKRVEHEDHFDTDTDFTPFSLNV